MNKKKDYINLPIFKDGTFFKIDCKKKIIHHKLHYAGHTEIVKIKIKSNRSYVSLIHAQTCV